MPVDSKKALEVFGLEKYENISSVTLRSLYKDLAKKYHPDKDGGNQKKFVELQESFDFLLKKIRGREKTEIENIKKEDEKEEKQQEDTRDLKTLDKNEILDKYYKIENTLSVYEESFKGQEDEIESVKERVDLIINEFESKKRELREELEKEVVTLEKKYSGGFLRKMLFFLPKMSDDEFWVKYNSQVETYSKARTELDLQFFKKIIKEYGDSLNNIQKALKDL